MASFTLPPISSVATLTTAGRAEVLDALFEPCTALHTLSLSQLGTTSFGSYDELIEAVRTQLYALAQSALATDIDWLDKILRAHPRLGAKKVESAQSQAEQAQLNTGGAEEAAKLAALNQEYEEKFPGLRYVVFVNGRSRPVIMENMRARIDRGDIAAERREAIKVGNTLINAICPVGVSVLIFTFSQRQCVTSPPTALASCYSTHESSLGKITFCPVRRPPIRTPTFFP